MSQEPFISILLVGTGAVPQALVDEATSLFGPFRGLSALCFESPVELPSARASIRGEVERLDEGRGVVLLADLCGSTLSNVCYELARERPDVDVVCGVSLAMLTKLWSVDRSGLAPRDLALRLADTGRRSVAVASDSAGAGRGGGGG